MTPGSVECVAPAKINLGLHVLRRRDDGFHDITTVLLPIGWHDTLRLIPSEEFRFTCSDPTLPTDERNLCVRAALALAAWADIKPHGALHLEKRVPHGAGLGGGSSDAAHTLRILAAHWGIEVPISTLHALATALGSDVPFFLYDVPMLATGRGEDLRPLDYVLPYHLVVVMPRVTVGTAEAYRLVRPESGIRPDIAAVVLSGDLERWRRELINDFEEPVLACYPDIRILKRAFQEGGAGYVSLSGSGAALFGVFEQAEGARQVAREMTQAGLRAWSSLSQG